MKHSKRYAMVTPNILYYTQWRSKSGQRRGRTARGCNQQGAAKLGDNGKNEGYQGASGISRLLWAAKSAPGTDHRRYAATAATIPHAKITATVTTTPGVVAETFCSQ